MRFFLVLVRKREQEKKIKSKSKNKYDFEPSYFIQVYDLGKTYKLNSFKAKVFLFSQSSLMGCHLSPKSNLSQISIVFM